MKIAAGLVGVIMVGVSWGWAQSASTNISDNSTNFEAALNGAISNTSPLKLSHPLPITQNASQSLSQPHAHAVWKVNPKNQQTMIYIDGWKEIVNYMHSSKFPGRWHAAMYYSIGTQDVSVFYPGSLWPRSEPQGKFDVQLGSRGLSQDDSRLSVSIFGGKPSITASHEFIMVGWHFFIDSDGFLQGADEDIQLYEAGKHFGSNVPPDVTGVVFGNCGGPQDINQLKDDSMLLTQEKMKESLNPLYGLISNIFEHWSFEDFTNEGPQLRDYGDY